MLTRSEAADPAVEDLKRRARRRLVGAIVLALAAAVILPLLLESDPKPLGDDVSIQIPPIDNGRFITPLSPAKRTDGKVAPEAVGALTPANPPTAAPVVPDEPKPISPVVATDKPVEPAQAVPADAAAAGPSATSIVTPNPEPQKAATPASKAGPGDASPAVAAPTGGFVVQLAAFADAKAAATLLSKLKSVGFPAYTEVSKTPQGIMRRVRVGPYATREIADGEMVKLKAAGYRGVVTTK
jgi:DedD protein